MKNEVAVITGGASGIGKSLCYRYGRAGYTICIGDIEEPALTKTVDDLAKEGIVAYGYTLDVSNGSSMENFTESILDDVGTPGIICLNAGVGAGGPIEATKVKDWEWILAVNLWGVIFGVKSFLPILKDENDGHIVFTSSIAGHLSYPGMGPYNASKHAVLTIAETLYFELEQMNSNVGVSALCPGLVRTGILESDRNRQEKFRVPALQQVEQDDDRKELIEEIYANSLSPDVVADLVFDAVEEKKFYIFTDNAHHEHMRIRHQRIESGNNPTLDGDLIDHITTGINERED